MDNEKPTQSAVERQFITDVLANLDNVTPEIGERNETISELDEYIYGDGIEMSINVPSGHDKTPVNWLRRAVEVHSYQFMGHGFSIASTYDVTPVDETAQPDVKQATIVENNKKKKYAESINSAIKAIMQDNGGNATWYTLAENASAVGFSVVKAYYDEKEKKYEICPIESVENVYILWTSNNFREFDALAYVHQEDKNHAIREYGIDKSAPTSPMGSPLKYQWAVPTTVTSNQAAVTIISITGYVPGYAVENGKIKAVAIGKETRLHAKIVADKITVLVGEEKKIPKYYLLPNKLVRRRPWGVSDISTSAIELNITYVETLSDWRTVANKVNFPKFKAYGYPLGSELPKPKPRSVEIMPMGDGQDIQPLNQGDANQIDFRAQLEELKEQFVRETRISRVFFDDPSITLNSNQALLTSMKPTTDVADAKKKLWEPIITEIFSDALETIAQYDESMKEIVGEGVTLRVNWPSVMQKEDPTYQMMLLNRFNAGTLSLESFLAAQGEDQEEIDRMKEEFENPFLGAVISKQLPALFTAKLQAGMPQGQAGNGFLDAPVQQSQTPITPTTNNQEGQQPVSMPGSGATATSPAGAISQTNQNIGG